MSDALAKVLTDAEIVVLLGAGGVGKTTSSTVLAVAAARMGKRVALLSIDPAKRLADALGISLGSEMRKVELPDCPGSLHAAMIDQKQVFDQMVKRHSPSAKIAEKILAHPVYVAASTNLAGPIEYMALAKLQELADNTQYDLVVLDTPPDTHALDFLARPNVLGGFMENKVMSVLVKPFSIANKLGLGKIMSMGGRLMGGIAQVTGVSALRSFAEFLVLVQDVIVGFHRSGERIVELLGRSTTKFCMVALPTTASERSAQSVTVELKKLGYACSLVMLNRCLPEPVRAELEKVEAPATGSDLAIAHSRLVAEKHAHETLLGLAKGNAGLLTVSEQPNAIHTLTALVSMADDLLASSSTS